jgi:hypothetical protein
MNAWTDFDREGKPEVAVLRPVSLDADTIWIGSSLERLQTSSRTSRRIRRPGHPNYYRFF